MPEQALPFPLPVVPPRFTPLTAAAQNRRLASKLYADFFAWPIERSRRILETTSPEVWEREGQRRALQVFHAAAARVPAYKDFLKKHKVSPEKVRTIVDLRSVVPVMDKKNYLHRYPLEDLAWDGTLGGYHIISVSSGSTGEPFLWPRGSIAEFETTYLFELLLGTLLKHTSAPTLFINCWAMGMWIGGTITLNSILRIAQKGAQVSVVTPGNMLEEVLRVIPRLRPHYKQLILAAYPPFLKDIIDEGRHRGINWPDIQKRFLLAGEGISETWRDYMSDIAGIKNPTSDFVSLYGTADAGALGHETPFTIYLRRMAAVEPKLCQTFFGERRLPSLLQYYPTLRYFEVIDSELHFTTGVGIPLVRYNINDKGGIIIYRDASEAFRRGASNQATSQPWQLPAVYLFGRSDFTATLYGANIYPESIRTALENPGLRKYVTGKLTMSTEENRKHDQYLIINVELATGVNPSLRLVRRVRNTIVQTLLDLNAEYRDVTRAVGKAARPRVRLRLRGDSRYFGQGIKQRWTAKKRVN